MARPEKEIDPTEGPLQSFAYDLRALRNKKGLTYRQMADETWYSPSALAAVVNGKKLPKLDVVLAYVNICDADADEWTCCWQEVRAELAAARSGERTATNHWSDPALRDLGAEVRRLWANQSFDRFHVELGFAEQPDAVRDSYSHRT